MACYRDSFTFTLLGKYKLVIELAGVAATIWTCIREMLGSIFGWDIGYQANCFNISSHSLFNKHPTFPPHRPSK
jgi:hypothetical protein